MKAQVLHKYDPEKKEKVWVTGEEMPDPKIEKASDVIVKTVLSVFFIINSSPEDKLNNIIGDKIIKIDDKIRIDYEFIIKP